MDHLPRVGIGDRLADADEGREEAGPLQGIGRAGGPPGMEIGDGPVEGLTADEPWYRGLIVLARRANS